MLLTRLFLFYKETAMDRTFAVAIGGAAGQGVATPGDIFAKLFARRGLHINAQVTCFSDRIGLLIPLDQDSIDRHLGLKKAVPPSFKTAT